MPYPINLKVNRVIGHYQGLVAFEIWVPLFAHFGQALSEIFQFPDLLRDVCPIKVKLNRVTGHHQGLVAFEIGVGLFACFRSAVIQNILVVGL